MDENVIKQENKDDNNILGILSLIFAILGFFVPFLLGGFILVFGSIILGGLGLKKKAKGLAIGGIILGIIALITSPSFWILLAGIKSHNEIKEKQNNSFISQNLQQEEKKEEVKKDNNNIYKNKDVIDKFEESFNKKSDWIIFNNLNLINYEKYLISATNIKLIETFDDVKHYSKYEGLGIANAYFEGKDENGNQIYIDGLEEFNLGGKNYLLMQIHNRKGNIYGYLIMNKDNFEIYIMQKL